MKLNKERVASTITDTKHVFLSVVVIVLALYLSDIANQTKKYSKPTILFIFTLGTKLMATALNIDYLNRTSSVLAVATAGNVYHALITQKKKKKEVIKNAGYNIPPLTEEEKKTHSI